MEACVASATKELVMNVQSWRWEGERAHAAGEAIYEKLVPQLRQMGYPAGRLIGINIESGEFVVADARLQLIDLYKEKFGDAIGWVKEIDYGDDEESDRVG
jgi:hypothetical protein